MTLSEPMLARPTCTIIESYSGRRWNHGLALPGQGREVVEPTVSKPKPAWSSTTGMSQFLSRPADRPNGVGEIDAHHIRFQNGVGVVEHQLLGEQQRRDVLDDVAELDHLIVCLIGAVVEHEVRFDDVLVAEGEQIGGGFVDGVVPEASET